MFEFTSFIVLYLMISVLFYFVLEEEPMYKSNNYRKSFTVLLSLMWPLWLVWGLCYTFYEMICRRR